MWISRSAPLASAWSADRYTRAGATVIPRRFDLSSVGDAHALIKNRQAQGKVVIEVTS